MAFNKISTTANLLANALTIALAPGQIFALPPGQGVLSPYGAVATPQLGTNNTLSGQYFLQVGPLTTLQVYDAGLNYWRGIHVGRDSSFTISSDGTNYRLVNTTGCPVGAIVTAAGSGGTNGFYGYNQQRQAITIVNGATTIGNTVFTITPSAGGSLWNAIVGGMVNSTISLSGTVYQNGPFGGTGTSATGSGGSNYQAPPMIVFAPPPNQGAQPYVLPQAVCTISGGAINSITMTQQGAGLLGLPQITVVPQFGDTQGGGAVLGWTSGNSSQVNSGAVSLMWPTFYGTAQTSVPTFTYGGSASPGPTATAIMNFTITAFGGSGGVGYGTTPGGIIFGGVVAGTPANNSPGNPSFDKGLSIPINPPINVATATGIPTLAGPFGGSNYQAVPSYCAIPNGTAAPGTANTNTCTVGGANDTSVLISI